MSRIHLQVLDVNSKFVGGKYAPIVMQVYPLGVNYSVGKGWRCFHCAGLVEGRFSAYALGYVSTYHVEPRSQPSSQLRKRKQTAARHRLDLQISSDVQTRFPLRTSVKLPLPRVLIPCETSPIPSPPSSPRPLRHPQLDRY